MSTPASPRVVLCILDGVGERTGPDRARGNAILAAEPTFYPTLFERYPHTTLQAGGLAVGLPEGQMGNSEVGHLTIGAGRVIYQELVRISKSLVDGEFQQLETWRTFVAQIRARSDRLHLLGLVSPGGVHSHTDHLYGIIRAAQEAGIAEVYVHAFLDGRDTDPHGGLSYMEDLLRELERIGLGRVATVSGRYYAMDRDQRWPRTERAWDALVHGRGERATDPLQAIRTSYDAGVTDEFVVPVVITDGGAPVATVRDGDGVLFWNFRADRARQLTWAFVQEGFAGFDVSDRPDVAYLCMTPYDETLDVPALYHPVRPRQGLAEVFAERGIRNLRTAETEKYAHVTYFFNGGREEPYPGESREMVPSPQVATYDLQPEMSAPAVAEVVRRACAGSDHDVVVVNFANGDMVGHTGVFKAAVAAFQTLDRLLGEIMPPSLERGTVWLVTADHGNCDEMIAPDGTVLTQHSLNRVPFVVCGRDFAGQTDLIPDRDWGLVDIAPTVLRLLGEAQPAEMTGRSMIP